MKKKSRKLTLHRETLRHLEPRQLGRVGGGVETLDIECLVTQFETFCGGVTCGPCANTVVNCPGGGPG